MKVGIVGAGPAGLFSAYELSVNSKHEVTIFEQGGDVENRQHRLHGIGGAGTFSDGKLNMDPTIGGNLLEFVSKDEAYIILSHIEDIFTKLGVNCNVKVDPEKGLMIKGFQEKALRSGIEFAPYKTIHIGTDVLPKVITQFKRILLQRSVSFVLNTRANDILVEGEKKALILQEIGGSGKTEKLFEVDALILVPGRTGAQWLKSQCEKLGINKYYGAVDVGVRVEVPASIMEYVTSLSYDAKLRILRTPTFGDSVRTFCTCPRGFVVAEEHDGFVGVNGHSEIHNRSENSNFALLSQVVLTEPLEDSNKYSTDMAKLAYDIGGGKPILQRLGDLEKGRRSTWQRINENKVKPTLRDVTPGDISMALTGRILTNMKESLYKLDKIISGVADDSTLLYAPEFKTYALRIKTNKMMETNIPDVYIAGDGAGISRGIVGAAWSGILAARGIMEKYPEAFSSVA